MIKFAGLFLAIAVIPLLLIGCNNSNKSRSSFEATKVENTLGFAVVETIKNADQITFANAMPDKEKGFKVIGEKRALSSYETSVLKQILLDDRSYIFDMTKACLFIPEAVVTFEAPAPVQMLISPSCKQVKFLYDGKSVILDCDPIMENLNLMFPEIK